jgi:carbamoyl-phosphate synthase large subunit
MECFRSAAATLGIPLRVVAVDVAPELSAACSAADRALCVPRCTDASFVTTVADIVCDEEVQVVVPTIDTELPAYAEGRVLLREAGTWVSVPSPSVVAMARDKLLTAERLGAAGIPVPSTETLARALAHPELFPGGVIVKRRRGSASIGMRTLRSICELEREATAESDDGDELIVQEYLPGPEYTVNLFFDRKGSLRSVVPHRRLEVRAGEVSKARTVRDPRLIDQAVRLAAVLDGAVGSLCYQAIDVDPDEEPRVIEVNARFGGGYPVTHRAGAPFARWILEEALGREPSVAGLTEWREGVMMLRYDTAVFSE